MSEPVYPPERPVGLMLGSLWWPQVQPPVASSVAPLPPGIVYTQSLLFCGVPLLGYAGFASPGLLPGGGSGVPGPGTVFQMPWEKNCGLPLLIFTYTS